jgi:hypothetical protein
VGAEELFVDTATASGLDFLHVNGMSGSFYFSEMMGSGGALLDYDNDGDLDVYLVQGGPLEPTEPGDGNPVTAPVDRLYRNDLEVRADGHRTARFVDVTPASGIHSDGYGMGVATGDFDNDGWTDIYVANFGANRLYRNNGDGSFSDATAASGTGDPRWSVSATFVDFDSDGWTDLYVANYVEYTVSAHKGCRSHTGAPDYCSPLAYPPQSDRLYRNRGDGGFEAASVTSGIGRVAASSLGVVAADLDRDGWTDLYVANDQMPNWMWINNGDGTFSEGAVLAGAAVNSEGRAEAGMGVGAGDFDGDGDEDLIVTHINRETNTLYRNDEPGFFEDGSTMSGAGPPSFEYTGFGTAWFDYDNDGWLDLAAVNGAVKRLEPLVRRSDPHPLHQPNQIYRNLGEGRLEEVSATAGKPFALSEVSRGLAVGDVDNDGDPDLLITNNLGPVRLLLNQVGSGARWVGLRLRQDEPRRDPLNSLVIVHTSDARRLHRWSRTGGSYASAHDPRVLAGLASEQPDRVEVRWPNGRRCGWRTPPVGRYLNLTRTVADTR